MPSMANIAVLNAAAASVTYNAATASAGDNVPATWKQNSASSVAQFRPEFRLITRDNQRKNGRVFKAIFKYPVTGVSADTGLPFLVANIPLEVNGTLPTTVDVSKVENAFVEFGNLLVSTLVRQAATEGYAPT